MLESVKNRAAAFFSEEPFLTVLKLTVVFGSESGPSPGSTSLSPPLCGGECSQNQKKTCFEREKLGNSTRGIETLSSFVIKNVFIACV